MRFQSTRTITATRWLLTVALLATAIKFFYHKLQPDVSAISKVELVRICKGIAGCKSIQLRRTASIEFGHDVLHIDATIDRRLRGGDTGLQIEAEVEKAWTEQSTIFHAPWNKHSMKVVYE